MKEVNEPSRSPGKPPGQGVGQLKDSSVWTSRVPVPASGNLRCTGPASPGMAVALERSPLCPTAITGRRAWRAQLVSPEPPLITTWVGCQGSTGGSRAATARAQASAGRGRTEVHSRWGTLGFHGEHQSRPGSGRCKQPMSLPWVREDSVTGTTNFTLGPVTTSTAASTRRQKTPQARLFAWDVRQWTSSCIQGVCYLGTLSSPVVC